MTKKRALFILSIAVSLMVAYMDYSVVNDYFISKYGYPVKCLVVNNSEACRIKGKSVTVSFEQASYKIRIYGTTCRMQEFPVHQLVQLRKSKRSDILVLESNLYALRIIIMSFLLIAFITANFLLYRRLKE